MEDNPIMEILRTRLRKLAGTEGSWATTAGITAQIWHWVSLFTNPGTESQPLSLLPLDPQPSMFSINKTYVEINILGLKTTDILCLLLC